MLLGIALAVGITAVVLLLLPEDWFTSLNAGAIIGLVGLASGAYMVRRARRRGETAGLDLSHADREALPGLDD